MYGLDKDKVDLNTVGNQPKRSPIPPSKSSSGGFSTTFSTFLGSSFFSKG